jgi:hypothetical protein
MGAYLGSFNSQFGEQNLTCAGKKLAAGVLGYKLFEGKRRRGKGAATLYAKKREGPSSVPQNQHLSQNWSYMRRIVQLHLCQ